MNVTFIARDTHRFLQMFVNNVHYQKSEKSLPGNYSAVMLNNNQASPPPSAGGDAQIPFHYEVNDQYFSHS